MTGVGAARTGRSPDEESEGITEFLDESELNEGNVEAGEVSGSEEETDDRPSTTDEGVEHERPPGEAKGRTPSDRLNDSRAIGGLIASPASCSRSTRSPPGV